MRRPAKYLTKEEADFILTNDLCLEEAIARFGIQRATWFRLRKDGITHGIGKKRDRSGEILVCRLCAMPLTSENWVASRQRKKDYICTGCYSTKHKERKARDLPVYMLKVVRARAKRLNIAFDLEVTDIEVPDYCPVLGIPLVLGEGSPGDNSPSIDRIDATRGYVKGNIAVISYRANRIKNDATLDELKRITEWLSLHDNNSSC